MMTIGTEDGGRITFCPFPKLSLVLSLDVRRLLLKVRFLLKLWFLLAY
jgi:hypothetical protein